MMADELAPEIKSALRVGMIAETAALGIGGVIAFNTNEYMWIYGFAIAGSLVMLFLLRRAGAFKKRDD